MSAPVNDPWADPASARAEGPWAGEDGSSARSGRAAGLVAAALVALFLAATAGYAAAKARVEPEPVTVHRCVNELGAAVADRVGRWAQ